MVKIMQPKWIMQARLDDGELITEEASKVQIAEMLGSANLIDVMPTNYPTKHEVEEIGITNVVKRADWR